VRDMELKREGCNGGRRELLKATEVFSGLNWNTWTEVGEKYYRGYEKIKGGKTFKKTGRN